MKIKKFLYKKVNNTNDLAIKIIKQGYNSGIIIAEEQKKGRGQYGRKWLSFKGNLFLSVFFKINKKKSLNQIIQFNRNIIKKVLSSLFKINISIKLPNDLLIGKKKICGILQETIFFNDSKFLIVGIGINSVKNPFINDYPTTNLLKETGLKIKNEKIANIIKKNYEIYLKKFAIKDRID